MADDNLYETHPWMIDSGTFWRCRHGSTGYYACWRCGCWHPLRFLGHLFDVQRLLVAGIVWLAVSADCNATIMDTIGTIVLAGQSETIRGGFDYDPSINKSSAKYIVFTGPAPYAGVYFVDTPMAAGNNVLASKDGFLDFYRDYIEIDFSATLPFDIADITRVVWNQNMIQTIDDAPSGHVCTNDLVLVCLGVDPPSVFLTLADPPSGVPEPSSAALLLGLLGFLALRSNIKVSSE